MKILLVIVVFCAVWAFYQALKGALAWLDQYNAQYQRIRERDRRIEFERARALRLWATMDRAKARDKAEQQMRGDH